MKIARWVATAVVAAQTRLAEIEVELDTATGAEKKALKTEKGNLEDGVKQAEKAIDKLDEAIDAFVAHDMKMFLKR